MISPPALFQVAGGLYGVTLLSSLPAGRLARTATAVLLAAAVSCNLAVVVFRYHQAWPMLPMHLGAVALPLCLGLFFPFAATSSEPSLRRPVQGMVLVQMVLLVVAALCFPKDFYLPFLKSKTLLAHGFLWFGLVGKSCFCLSAAWALVALRFPPSAAGKHQLTVCVHRSLHWAVWGFVLWTVSMFNGELWAYLGWGTPVVWDDPALTMTMAAWFFYACFLHLHLTGSWSLKARALYASLGGLVVLALTCLPDLGPFRAPF